MILHFKQMIVHAIHIPFSIILQSQSFRIVIILLCDVVIIFYLLISKTKSNSFHECSSLVHLFPTSCRMIDNLQLNVNTIPLHSFLALRNN